MPVSYGGLIYKAPLTQTSAATVGSGEVGYGLWDLLPPPQGQMKQKVRMQVGLCSCFRVLKESTP